MRARFFATALILASFGCVSAPIAAMGDGGGGGGGGTAAGGSPSGSALSYNPTADYQKGVKSLVDKDFPGSLKAFRKVLTAVPRDANTNYLAGLAAAGGGNDKLAANYFDKAVKYDPNLIEAYVQLGAVRAKLGDRPGATEVRDALAKKLAKCGDTCPNAAEIKRAMTMLDAALAAGPQARLDLAPTGAFASAAVGDHAYLQAVSLINERRYDAAIDSLREVRKSFGPHPDVLTYLGFANRKLGRLDVAEGYYQAALEIAPRHWGALEYYGELKVERLDFAGARANLALLDKSCTFGCYQAEELRRWIAMGHAPRS